MSMKLARMTLVALLALVIVAEPLAVEAQPGKVYRLGILGDRASDGEMLAGVNCEAIRHCSLIGMVSTA
jgi:hypothetical protein